MIGRPTGRSVRPVGRTVLTLRQSDRQSDEIKHVRFSRPSVRPGRTKRLHDTIVGPTSRTDQSDRPVGPTIVPCKRPVSTCALGGMGSYCMRQTFYSYSLNLSISFSFFAVLQALRALRQCAVQLHSLLIYRSLLTYFLTSHP